MSSPYLLSGLVFCSACGKRYVGNVARGSKHTYRYYTCFSRQRYGVATCDSERLPAEEPTVPTPAHLATVRARVERALKGKFAPWRDRRGAQDANFRSARWWTSLRPCG